MRNIAIINLGSSDIKIKEGHELDLAEIFSEDKRFEGISQPGWIGNNFYYFTKKLCENYPIGIEFVEFPIVQPTIQTIKEDLLNNELEKIIFITTNQEKTNAKDTIYLGELLKKINSDNKSKIKKELLFDNIKIRNFTISENPSDYDVMMNKYKDIASDNRYAEVIYIGITAGTPAMNTAFLYNITNEIKGKVIPIYTVRNKEPYKLRIVEDLRKDKIKRELGTFVKKQLYEAAEVILKENKQRFNGNKAEELLKMMRAARYRRDFNFKESIYLLSDVKYEDPRSRSVLCDNFDKVVYKLQNEDNIYLLNEVKNNAIYKYENGAYTDFLGRIFRIQEEIYIILLKQRNLIKCDKEQKCFLNKDLLSLDEREMLNNIKDDKNKKLRYEDESLNIYSMEKILDELIKEDDKEYEIFMDAKKMKSLKQTRNKSILAHGYKAVSKENIDKNLPDIISFLNNLINHISEIFNITIVDDNFYTNGDENKFNKFLIELVKEL